MTVDAITQQKSLQIEKMIIIDIWNHLNTLHYIARDLGTDGAFERLFFAVRKLVSL